MGDGLSVIGLFSSLPSSCLLAAVSRPTSDLRPPTPDSIGSIALRLRDRGHHLATDRLQRRDRIDAGEDADDGLDAQITKSLHLGDQLARLGVPAVDGEVDHAGFLDRIVVPTFLGAVPAQHVELGRQVGSRIEVARVAVARHEAQRLSLPRSSNQDRRMGTRKTLRHVERTIELVVLAREWLLVAALTLPHAQADLD